MRRPRSWLLRGLAGLLLVLATLGARTDALAHELGYTEVWAKFARDGTYTVDVYVDVPPEELRPPDDSWIPELTSAIPLVVSIGFDGRIPVSDVVIPALEEGRPPVVDKIVVVQFRGEIPRGAKTFSWTSMPNVGPVLLMLQQEGGTPVAQWLPPGQPSEPYPLDVALPPQTVGSIASQYVGLGFTHILPRGTDHVLFVLGLFLLCTSWRPLLIQITSFTVAHSVTLALCMLGVLSLPSTVVEPLIAISIVAVAVENLFTSELSPWRPAVVFGFGLLHGLGFAGMLDQLGLPPGYFVTALVGFNVGVELGQLAVVGTAFLLVGRYWDHERYRSRVVLPGSAAIALVGAYWAVQRIFF